MNSMFVCVKIQYIKVLYVVFKLAVVFFKVHEKNVNMYAAFFNLLRCIFVGNSSTVEK